MCVSLNTIVVQAEHHMRETISQFKSRANDAGNWYTLNSSVPIVKTMNISTVAKYSL